MKKTILSLFAWALITGQLYNICYATTVDVNSAKTIASNFYSGNSHKDITSISLAFTETAVDGSPAYYVFNINSSDGFVIISADDAASPIIGYATLGHYNVNTVVPPLVTLLKDRSQQISYIKSHHLTATQNIANQWQAWQTVQNNRNARSAASSVAPLCTTTWNQTTYYNALCPGGTPTGCTATAMAQIMKYWNYPVHGTGSVSYNDTTTKGFTENYGMQSADFENTTYDWSAMPNNITSANAAVATLMYQCGVSVCMDYNSYLGSNSNVTYYDSIAWSDPCGGKICAQQALAQYFGYDSADMQGLQRSSYSDEAWDSILENELNNKRPIQYAGYTDNTKQEGHTWVCDGYDVNDNFHMNWGWSGDYDGYFSLDNLHADIYHLNYAEEALLGIQPAQSVATEIKETSLDNSLSIYPNPTTGLVTIYNPQEPVSGIEVYDMLGGKVFQSNNHAIDKSTIDLSSQPSGVYFIKLQSGEEALIVKVVKQ